MTNVVIYHVYNKSISGGSTPSGEAAVAALPMWPEVAPEVFYPVTLSFPKTKKVGLKPHDIISKLALSFFLVGLVILLISYAPSVYFWTKSKFGAVKPSFTLSTSEVENLDNPVQVQRSTFTPAFNPRLPKANRLVISALGINTQIQEASLTSYESALKKGVWRVSDFGAPSANSSPTILAAHRFGYLAWNNSYRHLNSFFNLPKLKTGDVVEIDWNQRKYLYEIYAGDEGDSISDYTADLILYTCVDLTGPVRVFKYARLLAI